MSASSDGNLPQTNKPCSRCRIAGIQFWCLWPELVGFV